MKAVDLFSGAGGFSLAAISSGYEIEFAVENDPHAVITYQNNICGKFGSKKSKLYSDDINTLDINLLKEFHFPEGSNCDLLLGGPPCQGFSTHRIADAGVDDPRNGLIHKYFEFVNAIKPRVFLMENVPGILWERHKDYISQFYEEGEAAGYFLFPPVTIDARDFGVPQRRRRVFILGMESEPDASVFHWPPKPTHANPKTLGDDSSLISWKPCSSVFDPAPPADTNDRHMNHTPAIVEVFKKTPLNGGSRRDSGRELPCHKNHNGHKDVYGRIDSALPAPTMTTACVNPSKGRFVHPTKHHGITAREAARIQTFPDDFVFHGGLMASGKQIGNAVPVALGQAIIEHISAYLLKQDECELELENQVKSENLSEWL